MSLIIAKYERRNTKKVILVLFALLTLFINKSNSIDFNSSPVLNNSNLRELPDPQKVLMLMSQVADWQIENGLEHGLSDWTNGAFFAGLSELATLVNNEKYFRFLIDIGNKNSWASGRRRHYADDYCVGQFYAELYELYGNETMISDMKKLASELESDPYKNLTYKFNFPNAMKIWNWCDALFMGPPVFSRLYRVTGDKKYLEIFDRLWWRTTDYLYSQEDSLFYRDSRYFKQKEVNGEKVFWSRGNGWVLGGLTRILQDIPKDFPSRYKYERLFKEMCSKIARLQTLDGTWHASLLDPKNYPSPETSGTGFYIYALTYGINTKLLDKEKFAPIILKGWEALCSSVHTSGKIGYVQSIAAQPGYAEYEHTEVYAAGAFMLAGSEIIKLMALNKGIASVLVKNSSILYLENETVEIKWQELPSKAQELKNGHLQFKIIDLLTGREVVSQSIESEGQQDILIFQTTLSPGSKRWYTIEEGIQKKYPSKVWTQPLSSNNKLIVWENDRVAFSIEDDSEKLEKKGNGIEYLKKDVPAVVNTKGQNSFAQPDTSKIGANYLSTNCLFDISPLKANGIKEYKILANGPVRTILEITYNKIKWNSSMINIIEKISLETGKCLNKIEVSIKSNQNKTIQYFPRFKRTNFNGILLFNGNDGIFTNWGSYESDNKSPSECIALGMIFPDTVKPFTNNTDIPGLIPFELNPSEIFIYYSGASLEKDFSVWYKNLTDFKKILGTPLIVKIQ